MQRGTRLVCCLCFAWAAAGIAQTAPPSPAPATTDIEAVFTATAPVIDGRLDEPAWALAPVVTDFRISDGGGERAARQVSVRVLYDRRCLYFGLEAFNDMTTIAKAVKPAKFSEHDAWKLDGLEWYLSANDPGSYYFFCVCPLGIKADLHFGGFEDDPFDWNGAWTAAVGLRSDRWVIEAAVPFSEVADSAPRPGDTWMTNFARTNDVGAERDRLTALNPKYSGFHYLGVKLHFLRPPP